MNKLVILELEGDFQTSGFRATLEVRSDGDFSALKVKGFLPPAPDLARQLQQHWQQSYRALGLAQRIKGQKIIYKGSINRRVTECRESAREICDRFRTWLNAESFQTIDRRLREDLDRDDLIRFLLRTDDPQLQKLPWHQWDFFERYTHAELALSSTEYENVLQPVIVTKHETIRILAILGSSKGIDLEADRARLAALPQAEVEFLVEPHRQQISDRLWEQHWDILFFAGHSETQQETGRIYINKTDSLSLTELKYGLRRAIAHGLQLAIFNSCDGLGLASELQQLNLPQIIVMREPIADQVAHAFLQYFLDAFSKNMPLYLAMRQARERLQGLEHQFPCASWLPVICQNSAVMPPIWQDLLDQDLAQSHLSATLLPVTFPPSRLENSVPPSQTGAFLSMRTGDRLLSILPSVWSVLWVSTLVTVSVMGLRWFGLLEPWEFKAFDQLMRLHAAEGRDHRLLVVAITQSDIDRLGNEYPISDRTLLTTLQKLNADQPRVIGMDIYREQATGLGWQQLTQYLQQSDRIIPICTHSDRNDPDSGIAPPPHLPALQIGFADAAIDPDGIVRRHLLALSPPHTSPCAASYSLSAQLALRYLEAKGIALEFPTPDQWQLGPTRLNLLEPHRGFYHQPESTRGHQILLNYRMYNAFDDIAHQVSLTDVLTNRVDPALIKDKVVLIGVTAAAVKDDFLTPYGSKLRGLMFHTQMVSQLLSAVEDQRLLLRFWPFWADTVWVWLWSVVGGVVICWIHPSSRGWVAGSLIILLVGVSIGGIAKSGVVLPLIPSLLAAIASGGLLVISPATNRHYSSSFIRKPM
jgi:CHASE2 domain-containing sensor protein